MKKTSRRGTFRFVWGMPILLALVNLMARYQVDKKLSVALHVNNALDKRYLSTVSSSYGTFGAPRSFIASMKYSF